MALNTYTFQQVVSLAATAMQSAANATLSFAVGGPLRAITEAMAGVVTWLQSLILAVLLLTRKATSYGADKDTWLADFGFARLPANPATGTVTFARFTATQQALIPVGAGVQTTDGTQAFTVTVDTTNPAYSAAQNGYVLSSGLAALTVPVEAATPGAAGNVSAGSVATITGSIPGVDTVSNAAAFLNGIDAESDPAADARFVLYLSSLSKATKIAVAYAITSTQQGLTYTITENTDLNGAYDNGYATIIVDDGSGYPSANLLSRVYAAIDPIKPLDGRFGLFPPTVLLANVAMILTTLPGSVHSTVTNAVVAALQNFINGLPLATSLPWSQLAAIAYGVPGVANVTGVTLNGSNADLTATAQNKLLAGTIAVS